MKIELLPDWNLHSKSPTFYDTDSVTMLELASKTHGKMNEVIEAFNSLMENVNKEIADFKTSQNQDFEVFETAMRQEFQDFIDTVDMKLADINVKIELIYNSETESLEIGGV